MNGLAVTLLVGLGAVASSPAESEVHRGMFLAGFEVSDFRPCGGDETWWLATRTADAWEGWDMPFESAALMTVYGAVNRDPEPGFSGFGHMSAYPAEIIVTEIIDIDPDGRCEEDA